MTNPSVGESYKYNLRSHPLPVPGSEMLTSNFTAEVLVCSPLDLPPQNPPVAVVEDLFLMPSMEIRREDPLLNRSDNPPLYRMTENPSIL